MVPKLACSDPLLMDRSSTHLALAGILNRSDTDGSISFIKKKKDGSISPLVQVHRTSSFAARRPSLHCMHIYIIYR